jgi:hypothetical protein
MNPAHQMDVSKKRARHAEGQTRTEMMGFEL